MIADMTHQAMVHNKNPQVRKYMKEIRRKRWHFEDFFLEYRLQKKQEIKSKPNIIFGRGSVCH